MPTCIRPTSGCCAPRSDLPHRRVSRIEEFETALDAALAERGPQLVEVDMTAIGPFAEVVCRARRPVRRAVRNAMTMSAILDRLRQPLRRGEVEDLRGLAIEEPLELNAAELPERRLLRSDLPGAGLAARLRVPGSDLVCRGDVSAGR